MSDGTTTTAFAPGAAWLTLEEIAILLNIGRRTIQTWRTNGKLPPPDLEVGKVLRWRRETIEGWASHWDSSDAR